MSNIPGEIIVTPPRWSVIGFTFSKPHLSAEFVVMSNRLRYVIHATDASLAKSPELREQFRFFLDVAENTQVEGHTVDDFYEWALEPLIPLLCEDARLTPTPRRRAPNLHDFLYAPVLEYTLGCKSEELVLVPKMESPETQFMFGAFLPESCNAWPCYLPFDIQLERGTGESAVPRKVMLPDGTPAFFKLMRRGEEAVLERELALYDRLRASQLPGSVRVARLLGLVCNGHNLRSVFGLLLTYIDLRTTSLTRAVESGAQVRLRRRWSEQVMRIVHNLHQRRLVWGGASPNNVIIDASNNAWLVGLGGGGSGDWVPQELVGTIDGDLVALKKIVDFTEGGLSISYS
ncbi:hypothetical protein BM221_001465 [Beauveria bassiana]|uniref:Protein kinase domain-containing protein n=1 Tax=Beauveria bassiana TaxID=176275 RepID=A0A2N6NVT6_BEABA|nr:hypothetical protein BM221_001465 [Beauveria bassiana]